jgi:hypothetical protein
VSLIDEALKRAQAAHRDVAASASARPWVPTPLPDSRRVQRRRMKWVFSATLLFGILVLAAFFFGRAPGRSRSQVGGASAGTASLRQRAAPEIARTSPSPAINSEVLVAPPPRGLDPSSRGQAPSPATRKPVSVESSPDMIVRPPADVGAAPAISGVKSYAGEVRLPGGERIELGGIVYSDTHPVALINGKVVEVGAVVEGFTVTEIQTDRVRLEGEGGTTWIRVK